MVDTLTIRVARPDDLAELDTMFARSYPKLLKADYPASVLVTALPIISRAQPQLLASGTFYVAERGDRIVGAGGWMPRRQRGIGDVRHVITDAGEVRRGVARAIFERIFERAGAAGVKVLVAQSTRTAVPFYRAMGFEVDGESEVPLRPGITFPAVTMHRAL